MIRPAWFNVALFTMSQRPLWMLGISLVVVLDWWNLADFYLVQRFPHCPEAMDPIVTFGVSGVLVTLLVLATFVEIRWRMRGFQRRRPRVPLPRDAEIRRAMLTVAADNCEGIARRYAVWLRDSGYGYSTWISVFLFFLLMSFLGIAPLHSGLMESVSALMRTIPGSLVGVPANPMRAPDEIYNVRNVVTSMTMENDSAIRYEIEYRLTPEDGQWKRTRDSIEAAIGGASTKLRFFSGDFPHVHRHVDVECAPPGCIVRGMPASSAVRLPVRAGVAEFEYVQPRAVGISPLPPLNLRAWLTNAWGVRMFPIVIERE